MARIPQHIVDQIYNAIDIVEVVSDYVPLKKRGANYWALSPFSPEKTPSFAVNPTKGIYKDFSSGKGGNAVNFLMEMEGYDYVESLKHLAKKYNIEIQEEEVTPEAKQRQDKRQSLMIVNQFAAEFFHKELLESDEGKQVGLSYFKERGILQSSIEAFQLGYAADKWDHFAQAAHKQQYNEDYLTTLGLCSRSQKTGKLIDRFRGRIIFPISSPVGKVLGFGGRILGKKKDIAKYINSPESEVYHKSQVLYGMHLAKKHIRDKDLCILTEGYMDTVLLHQNSIQHVVASSGTALTPEQIRLIRRFTQNVLMIYDGDAAGIKAALRGIDLLIAEGMNAQVLVLPDNHDPDSFIREVGPSAFLEFAKKEALNFVDFKLTTLQKDKDPNDPRVQTEIIQSLAETLARIEELVPRQMYIKQVAQRVDITETLMTHAVEQALEGVQKTQARERRREQYQKVEEGGGEVKEHTGFEQLELARQERELLRLIINYHDYVFIEGQGPKRTLANGQSLDSGEPQGPEIAVLDFMQAEMEGLQFENKVYEQLKEEFFQIHASGESINIHRYLNHEDPAIGKLMADLMTLPHEMSPNWSKVDGFVLGLDADIERSLKKAMYRYKYRKVQSLIEENRTQLKQAEAEGAENLDELLEVYMHLMELKRKIGDRLGTTGAVKGSDGAL